MDNNQQTPAKGLQNSSFTPIDPAFRPPQQENDPLLEKNKTAGPSSNFGNPPLSPRVFPSHSTLSQNPEEKEADLLDKLGIGSEDKKDHNSSDMKKDPSGKEIRMPSNNFLNLKEFPELEEPPVEDSETKKVLTIGGIIVPALLVTSVILFLVTRNNDNEKPPEEEPPQEEPPQEKPPVTPQPEDPSSKDTADLKHLKISGEDNFDSLLEKYYEKAEIGQVIEIIFYDEKNEPLKLIPFSEKMGVIIPSHVQKILTEKYNFFIIKTGNTQKPKAALVFQSIFADFRETEKVLRNWETYLSEDLKQFALLGEEFDLVEGADLNEFKYSNKYRGGRFINFMQDGSISLNYIVMRDRIVLSNNFDAFEKIIFYIQTRDDL